jgi:hypothetical protein
MVARNSIYHNDMAPVERVPTKLGEAVRLTDHTPAILRAFEVAGVEFIQAQGREGHWGAVGRFTINLV